MTWWRVAPQAMTALPELKDKPAGAARAQGARYAGNADRPSRRVCGDHGGLRQPGRALAGVARLTGRQIPDRPSASDVALIAAATHKVSRLLARDAVTSPLRALFTSYQGTAGPAELAEQARGQGGQKTLGELVTCRSAPASGWRPA